VLLCEVFNAELVLPDRFALKSAAFGKWFSVQGDASIQVNRTAASTWEFLQVASNGSGVTFKSWQNRFISTEQGTDHVIANRVQAQTWETYIIDRQGWNISIRTYWNKYWSAQPDGTLQANRTAVGPWEQWTLTPATPPPAPSPPPKEPPMPVSGATYTLQPINGLSSPRHLLSCWQDASRCDMWTSDDGSGRQRWVFNRLSDGSYTMKAANGVSDAKRHYLSCSADGTAVNLWWDDESGRQHWIFTPVSGHANTYLITAQRGLSSARRYLSCVANGTSTDLWTSDDGSGRQRWALTQV